MDLHYKPGQFYRNRDGARPSEIASSRPALATRIKGHESMEDFDANRSLRGGEEGEDYCARFNRQLRGGHSLNERD